MKNNFSQHGFTLIELMIALTLGLILVAVAVQLFISGQVNYRIQQAAATVQDSGVFSLNAMTKTIRLANHGNAGAMNDETLYGGIVLSAQKTGGTPERSGNLAGLKFGSTAITGNDYISKTAATDSAFGTVKSDQLVIIYQAPYEMSTCTGQTVKGPDRSNTDLMKGWYVVEKYYIKKRADNSGSDLYCSDAMFIAKNETVPQTLGSGTSAVTLATAETLIANYGTATGQLLAPNVEYMAVQLVVRDRTNKIGTMSMTSYTDLPVSTTQRRPAVIGLNLGWLVRSNEKVENLVSKNYSVLGQALTVPNDRFMRHVFSTTIALRNGGLGELINEN